MDKPYSFRDGASRFRFIGRDGSMGYRVGKVYKLHVMWPQLYPGESPVERVLIQRTGWQRLINGAGYCPYKNQDLFFQNWEVA